MCRLQFDEGPPASSSPVQQAYEAGDEAVEALLALACDTGMDYHLQEAAAGDTGAGYSEHSLQQQQQMPPKGAAPANAPDASSRYHCPFPGCKRSFAELWRLKVHYRAPPNIRGSGKERGHGMLLALACDTGMDYHLQEAAAGDTGAGYSEHSLQQQQQMPPKGAAPANAPDASSRYHCPFPGCKRSFAELWRLKVHYRAPPNIRGSGKERGHGMRLTHCPKCGAALKVGGHHVKCAAVTKEPAGSSAAGRRNRKPAGANAAAAAAPAAAAAAAAAAASHADAAAMAAYADAATAAAMQYSPADAAAAAGGSGAHSYYHMQSSYGLAEMQQPQGGAARDAQSLWHRALQLHRQQQQQQYTEDGQSYHPGAEHTAGAAAAAKMKYESPAAAAAAAPVGAASLRRAPSSDDSSSSRLVADGSAAGYSNGSGNETTTWGGGGGPSSSSGSGSEDVDGQQQQQQQSLATPQQQQQQQQLLALFGCGGDGSSPAAAGVKHEPAAAHHEQQQLQEAEAQHHQHPEAGQLLWQHMLLQHLQQHAQQTPGLSLPDLIQVASALYGNRVDTLVSAFGLASTTTSTPSQQEQAQLSQLAAVLGQHNSSAAAQ